jgi:hypothetical protein
MRGVQERAVDVDSRLERVRELYGYAFSPNISYLFDRIVRQVVSICESKVKHPNDYGDDTTRVHEATECLTRIDKAIREVNRDFRNLTKKLSGKAFNRRDWPFTKSSIANVDLFTRQLRLLERSMERKSGLKRFVRSLFQALKDQVPDRRE